MKDELLENGIFNNDTEEKKIEGKKETKKNEVTKKKRAFHLSEGVSTVSVKSIMQGIIEVNDYDKEQEEKNPDYIREPIILIVDSYGGSIYDGFGLMSVIDSSLTPVHGYCYSKAMSMGFAIFCVCHKRFAHRMATLMYHDGGTTLKDTITGIQQSLNQSKRIVARSDEYIVLYTNITQEELDEAKRLKEDWYLFGDEAMELGIVDELIPTRRHNYKKVG